MKFLSLRWGLRLPSCKRFDCTSVENCIKVKILETYYNQPYHAVSDFASFQTTFKDQVHKRVLQIVVIGDPGDKYKCHVSGTVVLPQTQLFKYLMAL